jgi:cyanophycinase
MIVMRPLASVAILAALFLSAEARAGSLVMVGGALEDERILREIVRRAGGPGRARIGILTSSSVPESEDEHAGTPRASNARVNGAHYVDLFAKYGAEAVWIPIDLDHVSNNREPRLVRSIDTLTGVFMGGGNQSRYLKSLFTADGNDSPVLGAIRRRYGKSNFVIAGTSAGTVAMVAGPMITGGESSTAL